MTKYTCTACNSHSEDMPCILEVGSYADIPIFCPYDNQSDELAEWNRVAPAQALESEDIIKNYTFRARTLEISTKEDVNKAIQELSDCITELVAIDWPEDIELKNRLGVKA